MLEVDLVEVLELLPGRERFTVRASVGWDHAPFVPVPDTMVGLSLDSGEPVVVRDTAGDPSEFAALLRDHHGVTSGLAVPMIARGHELGAIGVHTAATASSPRTTSTSSRRSQRRRLGDGARRGRGGAARHLGAPAGGARRLARRAGPQGRRGRITFANPGFEAIFGLGAGGAVGLTAADLAEPDTAAEIELHDRQVMAGGHPVEVERWHSVRGRERRFVVAKFPLLDRAGRVYGLGSLATDITRALRARGAARALGRLESVGQLAGGIAHDFNNLLAVIANYAAFVRKELPRRLAARPGTSSRSSPPRGARRELTRRLLLFSRRQSGKPEVLVLRRVIERVELLLRRTLGEEIDCSVECDAGCGTSRPTAASSSRCSMNLAINAREAMPDGGEAADRGRQRRHARRRTARARAPSG